MYFLNVVILLTLASRSLSSNDTSKPKHKFEKCDIEYYQKKFEVLPGRGWDNLNNEPKAQILAFNFSKCHYSQDNIYLLPDSVSLTPTKVSEVEINSESFSHFANYTTVTSQSINLEAHGSIFAVNFGGTFSDEKEQVKSDQLETKSKITRVQLRYNVFKSISEPDAKLHPTFRNRIMDIAGLVIENKDYLYPAYLADMIVRDFGTHVTKSIDAGAVLSKIDFLSSEYTRKFQSNTNKISVTASVSFLNLFGMSAKYSHRVQQTEVDEYNKNCEKTKIKTHGGTLYGADFTVDQWRLSVLDNLVPIDRSGDPIYFMISPKAFQELDEFTVNKVHSLIKEAVERYYSANKRRGCLDFMAINFNPDANFDGHSCEFPSVTFNFGGAFKKCSGPGDQCAASQQVNPLTGGFSCPAKYQSILLNGGLNQCRQYCRSVWIFWTKCHTECSYYQSFWCHPINNDEKLSGYRFGGFISQQMPKCPLEYFPLTIGLTAQMCVSINNDPRDQAAIKFGGLYSCSVGNPMARQYLSDKNKTLKGSKMLSLETWPKMCAKGYIAHLASVDQVCEISFCAETNKVSLGSLPVLISPPFISLNYNPNSTKVVVFTTSEGKTLIKSQLGVWETDEVKIKEKKIITGSVLGTFFIVFSLCLVAVLFQRRWYRKKMARLQQQYLFSGESVNYGAINENLESP